MSARSPAEVVVVGGGIIGLSIAWRAGSAGRAVTVIDPAPGHGATWAAAGMLAPVGEAHFGEEQLARLDMAAAKAWPAFAAALEDASGMGIGYLSSGTLFVAVDPSDRAAVDRELAFRQSLDLAADRLGGSACRTAEPLLSPGVSGGADLPEDHQVDNRLATEALLAACRSAGVSFLAEQVRSIGVARGRVTAVDLTGGERLPCDTLVLAAGSASGTIAGLPEGVRPPVRPVRGATLRLRAPGEAPRLRRTVRGLVHGRSCYLVPRRNGTVVVGATVEERGFDVSLTVGAIGDLIEDARRLVPALEEYVLDETAVGLRPGSPDNGPIVGTTGIDGLLLATGHYRNGILLAPVTAEEVLGLLGGGAGPVEHSAPDARGAFDCFRPDRFHPGPVGHRPPAPDADPPIPAVGNGRGAITLHPAR
jgi:glycine oxidase